MDDILNILDLYEKLIKLLPGSNILVISLIIIFASVVTYFKCIKNLHNRYRVPFWTSLVLILITLNLFFLSYIKNFLYFQILIIIFASVGIILLFFSVKHPMILSAIRLIKCKRVIKMRQFLETNKIKLFDKEPWYILTTAECFLFGQLCYQYFFYRKEYGKAYRSISQINENKLFYDEREKLYLMQINGCIQLGSLSKAESICSKIENIEQNTEYFLAKSIIEEYKGDMDKSSEYLQKSLDSKVETTPIQVQARLFNNFGRMRMLENNLTDAEYYYQKCLELSSLKIPKSIRHIVYQNIIWNLYAANTVPQEKTQALKYLDEYIKEFEESTVYDLFEVENFRLKFYRQFYIIDDVIKIIEEGFKKIKEMAMEESPEILCYIIASSFRLYTDNKINPKLIMRDLQNNWHEFFKLKMPEKYFLLKEIYIGMKMFNPDSLGREYNKEFVEVKKYMITQAFDDITTTLNKTSDYEIYFRVKLMKERVVCIKEFIKPYNFNSVYKLLEEIVNIYELNGLIIEAAITRLDIADESFSIDNIVNGKTIYKDIVEKQVNIVIQQLDTFKKYIAVPEIEVRIAFYCFNLGRRDKAKIYYERFRKHQVSILHFKDWIRSYYFVLVKEFS
ncbi:hypothetical protein ACMXKO_10160 [Clostridium tyrobutyricum]|uniref:tetratricopeptide repeat protein n=1 Tax=Clostridium tyrobutyricum TaxID=1519 RepID=UPI0039F72215